MKKTICALVTAASLTACDGISTSNNPNENYVFKGLISGEEVEFWHYGGEFYRLEVGRPDVRFRMLLNSNQDVLDMWVEKGDWSYRFERGKFGEKPVIDRAAKIRDKYLEKIAKEKNPSTSDRAKWAWEALE